MADLWISLKRYLPAIVAEIWGVVLGGILGALGSILLLVEKFQPTFYAKYLGEWPSWVGYAMLLAGIVIAQFMAFHRVRVDRDALRAQQQARNKPQLRIGELYRVEGDIGGRSFHWVLPVGNDSEEPAVHVRVELLGITPLPKRWSGPAPDFPYIVRSHPADQNAPRSLSRVDTQRFDLFFYFAGTLPYDPTTDRSTPGPIDLYVDGFKTHGAGAYSTKHFAVEAGESWRLDYRVLCDNAEPQTASFQAIVLSTEIKCERIV